MDPEGGEQRVQEEEEQQHNQKQENQTFKNRTPRANQSVPEC